MSELSARSPFSASFSFVKAAGRVPVVACGTFGGSIEQQAAFINRMSLECDAGEVHTSNRQR
jgi:hypothetical protein